MFTYKNYAVFTLVAMLTVASSWVYADSIDFFASNNSQVITLQQAFERLVGKPERALTNASISVFQRNHLEQGTFKNVLGTYQMDSNHTITGDNSENFTTSPYQSITPQQAFFIAHQLAMELNQESIAVFIPSKQNEVGEVKLKIKNQNITIEELTQLIKEKLPPSYSSAFSLSLDAANDDFNRAHVTQVEWLGNNINLSVITNAFPNDEISHKNGKAYLVYQDGRVELLD